MRQRLVILLIVATFCSQAGAQESTVIFKNEADFDIALSLSPYPDGAYWPTELPVVILGITSSTHSKQFELSRNTATAIRCEHCDRLRGDAFGAAGGGILSISFDDFDNMFTVGETYTFRGHSERLELSSESGRLWSGYGLSGQGAP